VTALEDDGLMASAMAAGPLRDPPPDPYDMVRGLDVALHGSPWSRPYAPSIVWTELLAEVRALSGLRSELQHVVDVYAMVLGAHR
jgi:hypothetical protein